MAEPPHSQEFMGISQGEIHGTTPGDKVLRIPGDIGLIGMVMMHDGCAIILSCSKEQSQELLDRLRREMMRVTDAPGNDDL